VIDSELTKYHNSLTLDRIKLPFSFDVKKLKSDLQLFLQKDWIDHFVQQNYEGQWQVIPLFAQAYATHPIQMIFSNPTCVDFVPTPLLLRCSYLQEVLTSFQCKLGAVRLMKLTAGSRIKEHEDGDLALELKQARLHIPITTSSELEFKLNGDTVVMQEGECWYLRLCDKHSLVNRGKTDRVHIVLDLFVNPWLQEKCKEGNC